jgi:hypothetical protein
VQLEVEAIKLLNHSRNDESPPLLLMSFDFSLYIIINISNLKHPLKQFFDKVDFGISKYDSYDSYASCGF